jgi:hypothetical protein
VIQNPKFNTQISNFGLAAAISVALSFNSNAAEVKIKAENPLPLARSSQTIELSGKDLASLGDLQKVHIKDSNGHELLCQAVDVDPDPLRKPDIVIFQADFQPNEAKTFTATSGGKQVYTRAQFKAHGRFVRERFDDFAWENDRIAHRMYGKALETWAGEPLTSSTVDIWSKRVPDMVIDEWYMVDNYHVDTGQGADFYSAGPTRGCGGNGLWADGKLWVSKNFVNSRMLAEGPIRVVFELSYEAFDVNGKSVYEVKRISLDAGSNLDHFQSFYKPDAGLSDLVSGVGHKRIVGQELTSDVKAGWLATWEKVEKNQGMQGVAIIAKPGAVEKITEDRMNDLALVKVDPDNSASYWAGFAWDKGGQFSNFESWKKYVSEFARGLESPVKVTIESK